MANMTMLYKEFYTLNVPQFCDNLLSFVGKCMLLDKTYTADQEPKGRKVNGQFTSIHRSGSYQVVSKI